MQDLDTRRRLDGSIDIDFYRHAVLTEHYLMMTGFSRGCVRGTRLVIFTVMLVAAALCIAISRDAAKWNEASAVGARHNSASLHPQSAQ